MSPATTIGKSIATGLPVHIQEAPSGLQCHCVCYDCNDILEAVHSPENCHFSHYSIQNCPGNNEKGLHEFAKKVLVENRFVMLANRTIDYINPRTERQIATFFTDVSATHSGRDLHFEIVVQQNFLNKIREIYYKSNNINFIRIDLTEPALLSASPEEINYAVLEDTTNKTFINETENRIQPFNVAAIPAPKDQKWLLAVLAIPLFLSERLFSIIFRRQNNREI